MRTLHGAALGLVVIGCSETVGDFGLDVVPPSVVSSDPSAGESARDRAGSLQVTFSEPIDPVSLTGGSVQLVRAADQQGVAAAVVVSTTAATLIPSLRLEERTSYEFHVTTEVRDLAGNRMQHPFTVSFSTEDLQWQPPIAVSTSSAGGYLEGGSGVDASGRILVLWSEGTNVWAQRVVDGSLQDPTLLDSGDSIGDVTVGVADNGFALALWKRSTSGRADLWSAFFDGSSWSVPTLVETNDSGFVGAARLDVNATGFAVASWNQTDSLTFPFRFNVLARPFSPGLGWGTLTGLETRSETAEPPEVAVADNGNAIVNWIQSDGSSNRLWAAYFDVFDGWSSAVVVETSGGMSSGKAAITPDGVAFVHWDVAFNRYVAGSGWQGVQQSPNSTGSARLEFRDAESGAFAWSTDATGAYELWISEIDSVGAFGTPMLLASSGGTYGAVQRCLFDAEGRGLVLWLPDVAGRLSLAGSRSLEPGSWSPAVLAERDDAGEITYVFAADMGPSGEVAVLYRRYDGAADRLWLVTYR